MGRWGYCLIEGDQDLDLVSDISYEFFQGDGKPATSESDPATKAPDSQPILEDGDYDVNKDLLFGDVSMIRAKLDTDGAGTALLARYRAKEGEYQGKYRVLLFGALMMRAGARLSNEDRQHMRDLVSQVNCNEGYMWPFTFWDDGFRGPGQRQFLVALERYQVGIPRDFQAACCFNCGKTEQDTGKTPMTCGTCKSACYCDKDCQKTHWSLHKRSCSDPEKRFFLNV